MTSAEAEKSRIVLEAQAEAERITLKGAAEAEAIQAKANALCAIWVGTDDTLLLLSQSSPHTHTHTQINVSYYTILDSSNITLLPKLG